MKKSRTFMTSLLLAGSILAGCGHNDAKTTATSTEQIELTVSAAASLQDALTDLAKTYEDAHKNVKITYNFGGSGALQQQISQGAPVDVFFSAAEDKFDTLVDEGDIDKKDGTDLLANELVLVTPTANDKKIDSFEDLPKADKVALGTPDSVPAGQYGIETLKSIDVWTKIKANVVYAKDVRQVLTYAETSNVDAGIVYKTDALTSDKIKIVATADEKSHTPIIYPVGVLKNSKHFDEADTFYRFLQSDDAMKVFQDYGFKGAN
ncbi:molybdenum ABC transporter substrate-binding protein [Kurthia sp. 3B1D]|uniref:Molybdenum ABC transporter substrate-binding protein n=1 Tax=Candidatus Kurthia intestinigallinarum TaxID=1562256 RepID=A0A433RW01_9BACL|nr:molybdate ABC transporter substrate-binding protein [Kurthia sp. 3B1D]RUS57450.1 molybdenum ABC transporter substrate-binding protein [Kurthia sp. 3B1D]